MIKKDVFLKFVIPAVLFVSFSIATLIYFSTTNKEWHQREFELGVNGVISFIRKEGKGLYTIIISRSDNSIDSVDFLGIGGIENEYMVGDSISKKKKDSFFYIYRKEGDSVRLLEKREIR